MTSTVLDVAVCLVLVSAGAVTVATTERSAGQSDEVDADAVAETLATSTARVNGSSPATGDAVGTGAGDWSTRGTLAGLLAAGAVGSLGVDGTSATPANRGFVRAVGNATLAAVDDSRVRVEAVWRPYPGAPLAGEVAVGSRPPPDATVHAATLTLPSGFGSVRPGARTAAERDGYAGVAAAVARGVVSGLFPDVSSTPDRDAGDGSREAVLARRYRRLATLLDVSVASRLAAGDVTGARQRLVDGVAAVLERDLRRSYDDPEAAAEALRVDEVRIVVRTWP